MRRADVVDVINLATGERRTYVGLSPERAVVSAYEQERGNYSTWTYAVNPESHPEFVDGDMTVACGDWAAMKKSSVRARSARRRAVRSPGV